MKKLLSVAVCLFLWSHSAAAASQKAVAQLREAVQHQNTFVFAKRGGGWNVVAWQYVEIPKDPPPARVDRARLDDYVGEYSASAELRYIVSRKGDALFGSRVGRKEIELLPESVDVFFIPGSEIRKLFVRDGAGRVVEMVDRRKGSDLRWRKKLPAEKP